MTRRLRKVFFYRLVRCSGLLSVVAVAISAGAQQCVSTATQVLPLSAPFVQVVPHITTGAGFVTKFTIVNQSTNTNQVVFNNISKTGVVTDSTSCTIAPNGTARIATSEANRFATNEDHWALVGSQFPVGVNLFFEFIQTPGGAVVNTLGFNDVPPNPSVTMPVE